MTDGFCDLLNCLNTGRTGSDNRDTFTVEAHILFWPKASVISLTFKIIDTVDIWHGWRGKWADCGHEKT